MYIVDYDESQLCIQETSGSSYKGNVEYCVDDEEYHPEDECTYQRHSANYISPNCDSWRCPIIDEYARDCDRVTMSIHGVDVEVSDTVRYDAQRWLSRDTFKDTWTIDDANIRQEFFEYYGIEEDDADDEDEEAA